MPSKVMKEFIAVKKSNKKGKHKNALKGMMEGDVKIVRQVASKRY